MPAMKVIMFSLLLTTLVVSSIWAKNLEKIHFHDIVEQINSDSESTWKADDYGISEMTMEEVRDKLGAKLRKNDISSESKNGKKFLSGAKSSRAASQEDKVGSSIFLPISYDARQRYPDCNSISHVRDQSACGSCWAVSAASVFSDRLCIHSNGKHNFELSSRFIMSCDKNNYGCYGGYLDVVWDFLQQIGTVSGGEYMSDEGCQPYPLYPCGYPRKFPCPSNYGFITPKCAYTKCDNEFYPLEKEKRTFTVQESYPVGSVLPFLNEYLIRKEIYENGPVQVGFNVYADFLSYKSGIYHHKKRMPVLGGHAVKFVGWGEEKGVKYWIAANSWGEEWGEGGFFRIIRGINNCGIEDEVYAGIP